MTADSSTDTSEGTPEDNKPTQTAMDAAAAQIRRLIGMETRRGPLFSKYTRGYIHGLERALAEISYYKYHHETRGGHNGETPT